MNAQPRPQPVPPHPVPILKMLQVIPHLIHRGIPAKPMDQFVVVMKKLGIKPSDENSQRNRMPVQAPPKKHSLKRSVSAAMHRAEDGTKTVS
jgi:hypothetical protein